ncbi:hypothetical protein [Fulvivirga sp.]|uniref:hypothetical protein n=1 Tax=Fulvivirga sp. TaxID=1931237 RepID=UPI0032EBE52F
MKQLAEFTEEDFENLEKDIYRLSDRSADDLYRIIGNGLYDLALKVSENEGESIVESSMSFSKKLNTIAAVDYVENAESIASASASENGKGFFKRFKQRLKNAICNDEKIKKLMEGKGSLKEYLIIGIPMVLAALGMAALNPVLLAIIAATFALIVKVGWEAYCNIE